MPVNTPHPTYTNKLPMWKKCRVVIEGEDAVKEAGETYLPKLSEQNTDEYNAYKARASFYGATSRTIQGLAGAVMRKQAEVKFPKAQADFLKTIGIKNTSLDILIKESLEEVLGIGRMGLLVDAPQGDNSLPFVAVYYAENIINWQKDLIDGKEELTLVVLMEEALKIDAKDAYATNCVTQFRVLRLSQVTPDSDTAKATYIYNMEVWEEKTGGDGKKEWVKVSDVIPTKWGGKSWERIPFLFDTPSGVTDRVEKSPVLDMVNINLSLYRNSADLEHGLHFTALPTVWVAGFDVKDTKLKIGAQNAWATENHEAKCGMLEFSGTGLGAIREQMKEKKTELAVLGGRLLEEQKREAEAAAAISLRQAGDQSTLSNVAKSVSEGWTTVLRWCAEWMNLPDKMEDIAITLSQDFTVVDIDGPTLANLIAMAQGGLMSWSNLFYNLKRAEMVPDDIDEEEEKAKIEAGVPVAPPTPQQVADHELKLAQMKTQSELDKKNQPPPVAA